MRGVEGDRAVAPPTADPGTTWLTEDSCDLDQLAALVEQPTDLQAYPAARAVQQNVLCYEAAQLRALASGAGDRRGVQAELARAMAQGPGVVLLEGAFAPGAVDGASAVFRALLDEERAAGRSHGDHFAAPGTNERLWDALGKLARRDPEVFAEYYENDLLRLVAEAWLGPGYQVTSQVNVVNPGGAAQTVHCDYHLGFMTLEQAAAFPAQVHRLSPALTLQGAVAHCDMPLESGPTHYLPHSQKYLPGYLAWHLPGVQEYARSRCVQLPLAKGDAVFFSPAVLHAAGSNRSAEISRMANLLQVSSAFGRAMESVDREELALALFPVLLARKGRGHPPALLDNVVAAAAEGYGFPTNLDRDTPLEGLAPPSPAGLLRRALEEGWSPGSFRQELQAAAERRRARG